MELIRGEFQLCPVQQDIKLNSSKGSLMQGMMMERIRTPYGEILHKSELKPYSQYLYLQKADNPTWVLNTLTQGAAEEVWHIADLKNLSGFRLTHNDWEIRVAERRFERLSEDDLLEHTFFHNCPRIVHVQFVTPTAFKTGGKYQNYPTVRHLFQSLLNKFNAFSSSSKLDAEDILDDIERNTTVIKYRLQSTQFSLENVRIPSFIGLLTLKTSGPQQMVNLIYMLLCFGTYSGVGIKTAMGMGGLRIIERSAV